MLSAIAVSLLLAIFLGLDSAIPKDMGFGKGISTALFRAAIPEELSKFFFLWLLLRKNPHYNEYVDGIVYAACIGMGFAAFENVGYLIEFSSTLMATGLFRALFPVPGHLFFAVAMGYYYSCYRFGDPARRRSNLALAIVVPILLHFVYDAVLMVSTGSAIASALIFLFLGFFVFLASRSKKRFSRLLSFDMRNNEDGNETN